MPVRFRRGFSRATLVACVLCLAAGCVESTYVWSLNPGGTGKVKIDARVQVTGAAFRRSDDTPEEIASELAREVLKKSRGVAAWTDVTHGVGDDGRVRFKGTAYFDDLSKVGIVGDPFPTSAFKPSLSRGGDGRLEVGLEVGLGLDEKSGRRLRVSEGLRGLPEAAPEEPEADAVTRSRMAYQSVKPLLIAFLSTMRTETVVRLPGEVVEASNYTKREEGTVGLVFDGPKTLRAIEELALRDTVAWWKIAASLRDEEQAGDEFRLQLAEIAFGERAPVRAVVATDATASAKDLFNYYEELAGVMDARVGFLSGGSDGYWKLAGGPVASGRTDLGTGTGWTGIIGRGGGDFHDASVQVEVSRIEYENSDGERAEVHRATFGGSRRFGSVVVGGGLAWSSGHGGIWATGPQMSVGIGASGAHTELHLTATGYGWFGERDDEFDFDLEADVRLVAGIRF